MTTHLCRWKKAGGGFEWTDLGSERKKRFRFFKKSKYFLNLIQFRVSFQFVNEPRVRAWNEAKNMTHEDDDDEHKRTREKNEPTTKTKHERPFHKTWHFPIETSPSWRSSSFDRLCSGKFLMTRIHQVKSGENPANRLKMNIKNKQTNKEISKPGPTVPRKHGNSKWKRETEPTARLRVFNPIHHFDKRNKIRLQLRWK